MMQPAVSVPVQFTTSFNLTLERMHISLIIVNKYRLWLLYILCYRYLLCSTYLAAVYSAVMKFTRLFYELQCTAITVANVD